MSLSASSSLDTPPSRHQEVRYITLVGLFVNVVLAVLTILIGIIGHSQAVLADGLHTLSDLITDFIILIAASYSAQAADSNHPYGHERFETLATVVVGISLLAVGVAIMFDAGRRLLSPDLLLMPENIALIITVVGILSKEALYQYTIYVADRLQSQMLRAKAWHHRSDSISSIVVLIGLIGTMLGFPWLDATAAIIVSVMIIHIGWGLTWDSVQRLVDKGVDIQQLTQIKQAITQVEGVKTLHALRTRYMGDNVLVDVHILVSPTITVSEGHYISHCVRDAVLQLPHFLDVTVHVDSETDDPSTYNTQMLSSLPSRQTLLTHWQPAWQSLGVADFIQQVQLHYLECSILVEIILTPDSQIALMQKNDLIEQLIKATQFEDKIHEVKVYVMQ